MTTEQQAALLSLAEAADRVTAAGVPISKYTVYRAIAKGEFPSLRVGRKLVVPSAALERWLGGQWRPDAAAEPTPERPKRRPLRIVRRSA